MKLLQKFFYLCLLFVFSSLFNTLLYAQTANPVINGDYTIHYPKLSIKEQDFEKTKSNLTAVLKRANAAFVTKNKLELPSKDIKEIFADDEGIKIVAKSKKNNQTFYYKNLIDSTMIFYTYKNSWHYVSFPSIANFAFYNFYDAQLLADHIYQIQYPLIDKRRDSLIDLFKPIAAQYKATKKIALSEDDKKLYQQADQLNNQKDYIEALKIYNKAIKANPMTYPEIYSNIALLYAKVNFYDYAILYMRKYLLLEPGISEERNAKDKIYEWEAIIGL